eukprot:gene7274-8085_t
MADDVEKDIAETPEPIIGSQEVEQVTQDVEQATQEDESNVKPPEVEVAQEESKPMSQSAIAKNVTSSSFISTTDSMKNAARSKVDTVIAQVQQALRIADEGSVNEDEKEASKESGITQEELDDKFVVALFDSVVGGSFDLETCYDIRDPFDVLVILDLFDRVSRKVKFQILVVLHAVLKKSVENLQTCTQAGLITKLLDKISCRDDDMVADKMVEIVGILATYSITIRELKHFLAALQMTDDHRWPAHAYKLLGILKRMPEKHGPDVYFDFSGKPGSGIVLPPMIKWPHQPGFSFSTWLQLDAAHLSSVEQSMKPHIYSFMNSKGLGYSAHFSGPMLVLEVHAKANKVFTILVKFEFRPQIWYHVCVTYTYNRFKSSEIRCYVNGQMVTTGEINLSASREPMDKCFIGLGQIEQHDRLKYSFKGQMSAVYLFGEPLNQTTTAAIYRLGPGYKGKFRFDSELDIPLYDMDRKVLYDGKIASNIVFTYNPKAIESQMCLESSPHEQKYYFLHSSRAIMLEGVQSVVTQSLQAALHSLGGIQVLYPLFTQLDCPFDNKKTPERNLCILLLSLIYDLLRGSAMCQQQFSQSQGFLIIGHILEKSSECHLTEEVVDILLGLARYLMSTPSASGLLGSLLDHILLNPTLWIKTPLSLQANLLSLFATGYVGGLDYAGYIRKEVGVPRLMQMLRKYYSLSSSSANQATVGSSKEEIMSLRAFMILLIKQMIIKGNGIENEELRSMLVYLTIEDDEENYIDVLQLLLATMCEMPETIVQCFDNLEGFRILFLKLLCSETELVRVYCLKIIGAYIKNLTLPRKVELVEKYGFISMIRVKLLQYDLTIMTYNALFEVLTARVTKHVITTRHAEPDSTVIVYHPTILPVIVDLVLYDREKMRRKHLNKATAEHNKEAYEIIKVFLSDLVLLLNHSKDNRRLMLQLMCWQDWLFSLAYFEPQNKEEIRITDTVFTIVRMLLHYACQHEKEGWRVWVDTLAILHGKISEFNSNKEKHSDEEEGEEELPAKEDISSDVSDHVEGVESKPMEEETNEFRKDDSFIDEKAKELKKDLDVRREFFHSILQSSKKAEMALSAERDRANSDLKRSRSESDLDGSVEMNENKADDSNKVDGEVVTGLTRSASSSAISAITRETVQGQTTEADGDDKVFKDTHSDAQHEASTIDSTADNSSIVAEKSGIVVGKKLDRHQSEDLGRGSTSLSRAPPMKSKSLDLGIGKDHVLKTTFIGAHAVLNEEHTGAFERNSSEKEDHTGEPVPPQPKTKPYVDVPEFSWSPLHQRLLTELLFAIESDVQVWKTHTRKALNDFISAKDNQTYVANLCHMVSILADSLIFCCGGLLPLLSSSTSRNFANDVLQPCGGMSLDGSFSFLNRVMDLVDVIAFASSVSFSSVESHRNMPAGGVLKQCIRLVFCSAARNRVVCRQREVPSSMLTAHKHLAPRNMKETDDVIRTLIASTKPATNEDVVQNIPGHMTTITHPERLLQDLDLNRLRALVYREVEDSRQSQYVALVVIYYVAVLMVARYRDILENETENPNLHQHRMRAATWTGAAQQPLSSVFSQPQSKNHDAKDDSAADIDYTTGYAGTPGAAAMEQNLTLEQRIEMAFKTSCALLKEILFDFAHYLSRILVGSHGQDLIADGLGSLKSADSTVELVMLMCSQEWQNSLQKHAGVAFMELIDEGRKISYATRTRIVVTATEARDIMREKDEYDRCRHSQFEDICAKTEVLYYDENRMYDEFFRGKKKRNSSLAETLLEKTFDLIGSEFGAWPVAERDDIHVFYKLDTWEDNYRRRLRMIKNALGTTHPEAVLDPSNQEPIQKVRSSPSLKYHLYRKKTLDQTSNGSSSEDEEGDGDLDVGDLTLENQSETLKQQMDVIHTVNCHVIAPGVTVAGTLAITSANLYFTAEDADASIKKIDPQVNRKHIIVI